MIWSIIFAVAIGLLLLRVFWLHVKSSTGNTKAFKSLAPKDKLAVLKECLLNNASTLNLMNLADFGKENGLDFDTREYEPLLQRQLELAKDNANYIECDNLYIKECAWVDKITPLEFAEAAQAKEDGDRKLYIERYLEGVSRLYSDEAILETLAQLEPDYPKAKKLGDSYHELMIARDASAADDKSLEALRKKRDAWMEELLKI